MTLTERLRTCTFEGCKRAPAYPDQSRCEAHRLPWVAPWRKRAMATPKGLARPLEPA